MLSPNTSGITELEQYPEWKDLLTVLLVAIAKRLTSLGDYSSFRGVCSSWRSAATFDNFDREFFRVPRLLYFVEEREETPVLLGDVVAEKREETPVLGDDVAEKEGITGKTVKKIVTNMWDLESSTCQATNFPPAEYLSCSGWILCLSEDSHEVSLKHFMLPINIKLPGLDTFLVDSVESITKMVLSGSPFDTDLDLVVMVIWGMYDHLAFCRPGDEDEGWTIMDCRDVYTNFYDIIYHNSKLYALDYTLIFGEECDDVLDSRLTVVECDVHGTNPTECVEVFAFPLHENPLREHIGIVQKFLVESNGKFLIVLRCKYRWIRFGEASEVNNVWIYEIDLKDGRYKKIDNLGRRCLFLGLNSSSICVEFPSRVKLKPNCIYFSVPCKTLPDVVVYSLCDRSFEYLPGMLDLCFPQPTWVVPTI